MITSKLKKILDNLSMSTKIEARVKYITEDGWEGRVRSSDTWIADSKEELFERLLKTNHQLQRQYKSYEFENFDLMDEYDEWWANLSEERKAQIQGTE